MEATKHIQDYDAKEAKKEALAIIRKLVKLYEKDPDKSDDEYGNLWEYGLGFGLNSHENVLERGEASYWTWVICTGGPHVEFRFYRCETHQLYRVEFVYKDWYYVKRFPLKGKALELLTYIFEILNGGE